MSELVPQVPGLVSPVVSEEDPDHGVRLDDRVRSDYGEPPYQSLTSLVNNITGDTNNIGQELGWRQFGNEAIRKPDNDSQSTSQSRSVGAGSTMVVMRHDYIPQLNLMG